MRRRVLVLATLLLGGLPAAAQEPAPIRLREPVPDCPVCAIWLEVEPVILKADQDVAPLRDGMLYFYHSREPAVIERLIRFAHERTYLEDLLQSDPGVRTHLGEACRHREYAASHLEVEISIGAHGFFALLRSRDADTVQKLRVDAQRAVKDRIPVWF